jgi:hypothetical protein
MNNQTDRVWFTSVCPQGHNRALIFDRTAAEGHLEKGTLQFYCLLCHIQWTPSHEEQLRFSACLTNASDAS